MGRTSRYPACVTFVPGFVSTIHSIFTLRTSRCARSVRPDRVSEPKGDYLPVQTKDIEQDIRGFLIENFLFGRSEALTEDVPLLGNVIDSTGVIELIVFIQERFAISVGDEEVTTDNLGSLRNVVAFVQEKLRTRA